MKFGCSSEMLREWVCQAEQDRGLRPGLASDERTELGELSRANGILGKASAYFAQAELDRGARR